MRIDHVIKLTNDDAPRRSAPLRILSCPAANTIIDRLVVCRRCRFADDVIIVTPFAQILHCLRRVWTNYLLLTNIPPSKYTLADTVRLYLVELDLS